MTHKSGYIYFLNARGTNRYKIGLTVDLQRRLKELNGQQAAFPIDLRWSIRVSDMRSAEKALHDRFQGSNPHGEWFEFEQRDLPIVQSAYQEVAQQFPYTVPKPIFRAAPDYEPEVEDNWQAPRRNPWLKLWDDIEDAGFGAPIIVGLSALAALTFHRWQAPSIKVPAQMQSIEQIPTATTTPQNFAVPAAKLVTAQLANIRATPNGKILCQVKAGTELPLIKRGEWSKVHACGTIGLVHRSIAK